MATLPARALTITGYSPTVNDIYSSGYPTSPVRNTNVSFIGTGYDFTGIGWAWNDPMKAFGFLSPDNYLVARHYGGAATVNLFGGNNSITPVTQSSVTDTGYGVVFVGETLGDISVGTLTAPVPTSAQVARYAVLDLNSSSTANTPSAYLTSNSGLNVLVTGHGPTNTSSTRVGSTAITSVATPGGPNGNNSYFLTSYSDVQLQDGDSGSPDFIGWTNPNGDAQLTIIGNNAGTDFSTYNAFNFLGSYQVMNSMNTIMNPSGYALQVVGNTSQTWTGGGGNTNINNSSNWSGGLPSDTYVLFNAASASSTTVNMNVTRNLRGLYFKATASTSDGFTISGSNALTIGRGGVTNYDNSLQTISAPIILGSSQYWNSGTGGIQTGNINTNGNLLELGGAGTTTITGDISGSGSVALSGTKAILSSTNSSYTGKTWVHTGQLVVNGSIATSMVVTVEAGASLAGHGTVSAIEGAGSVDPGDIGGILTATSVDPASGIDFNFEFTSTGAPSYGNAGNSGNDVLHLTALNPFTSALDSDDKINVYFDVVTLVGGSVFDGGFFTEHGSLWSSVQNANFAYYVAQVGGSILYNGVAYNVYSGPFTFNVTAISQTANFGGGNINGSVLQVTVVPEPSVTCLVLLGSGFLIWRRFRSLSAA